MPNRFLRKCVQQGVLTHSFLNCKASQRVRCPRGSNQCWLLYLRFIHLIALNVTVGELIWSWRHLFIVRTSKLVEEEWQRNSSYSKILAVVMFIVYVDDVTVTVGVMNEPWTCDTHRHTQQHTQYLSLHGSLFNFQLVIQLFLLDQLELQLLGLTAHTEVSP